MKNKEFIHIVKVYFKNNNNIISIAHSSKEEALKVIKLLNQNDATYVNQDDNGNILIFIRTNDVAAVAYQEEK